MSSPQCGTFNNIIAFLLEIQDISIQIDITKKSFFRKDHRLRGLKFGRKFGYSESEFSPVIRFDETMFAETPFSRIALALKKS